MGVFFTYFVTLLIILMSTTITMLFKFELERMFGAKKSEIPFHFANLAFILMSTAGVHAMMTIYVNKNDYHIWLSLSLITLVILPFYLLANKIFNKYKEVYKPYSATDEKVITLNEKYLTRKQLPRRVRIYNARAKDENTLRKYKAKRFFKDE